MSYLLRLELRRLARMIRAQGLPPSLALIIFIAICVLAYTACAKDSRVPYLIMALGLTLTGLLQSPERQRFLAIQFAKPIIRKINITCGLALGLAPLIVLLLAGQFVLGLVFILLVLLRSLLPLQYHRNKTVPSPFTRWPFEFSRGFRQLFWLLPISVFILGMAWKSVNPNLGLFAIAIPYLMSIQFQLAPEDSYFVWIHQHSPKAFLLHKIKIALRYSAMLGVPLCVVHLCLFPDAWVGNVSVLIAGHALVITALLAKYAQFPSEMNLLAAFVIIISMFFPPLMLIAIPVLFHRAQHNIQFHL